MSAFFSFDKDFHPVFIDYCLMSHPDYTVQAIHLSSTHCRPFVARNVCSCVCFCEFLPPACEWRGRDSVCLFVNVQYVRVRRRYKQHAGTPKCKSPHTNPSPRSNRALIFCFMNRKVSPHEREKWLSHLLTARHINEPILCNLQIHPI